MKRCGGASETVDADETVQTLVNKVRPHAEQKSGVNFADYKAIAVSKQLVNGTNYFVKVHVGGDDYIHMRVYEPFTGEKQPELHGLHVGKTRDEELCYFDQN